MVEAVGRRVRVVSWNVAYRVGDAAIAQGRWLAGLRPAPDLVLLQEVNPRSARLLCDEAGLEWRRLAVDLRTPSPGDTPVRRRGVAVAGRGAEPSEVFLLPELPLPERALVARVPIHGVEVVVASYHAPPGVSWFEKKPQQAVAFARWLARVEAPAIFGADANTPLADAIDFAAVRTHWHTGHPRLAGAPGDDLLVGPAKLHRLDDVLRRWLENHPAALAQLPATGPDGPLRLSHRTGKRRTSQGNDRRFDAIWASPEFHVDNVDYPYDDCLAAGSDHAAVIADLNITHPHDA
jgi:endonuclease/exonuclease/phosphatase family metal-dependent hydrolase